MHTNVERKCIWNAFVPELLRPNLLHDAGGALGRIVARAADGVPARLHRGGGDETYFAKGHGGVTGDGDGVVWCWWRWEGCRLGWWLLIRATQLELTIRTRYTLIKPLSSRASCRKENAEIII